MSEKYAQLDSMVLQAITADPSRFAEIYTGVIAEECRRLAFLETGKEPFRVMDRRLQALRKSGKIKSTRNGWVKVEVEDA